MKRVLAYGDKYLQKSNWKDMGVIKYCVFSFGLLAGTFVPQQSKKCARVIALIGFVVTTILIMKKFFSVVTEKSESTESGSIEQHET